MEDRTTLPEAVRGCWYRIEAPFDAACEPEADDREVVAFRADGSFARYELDGGEARTAASGDYTFDGDFLIVRGRRTHTYRVARPEFWRWELEGKKDQFQLFRDFVDGGQRRSLTADVVRDIQLLPLRVRVQKEFEQQDDTIQRFVYRPEQGDAMLLATVSIQRDDTRPLWFGVAPLVDGIDTDGWKQIVRENLLGAGSNTGGDVIMQLFDTGETIRLDDS